MMAKYLSKNRTTYHLANTSSSLSAINHLPHIKSSEAAASEPLIANTREGTFGLPPLVLLLLTLPLLVELVGPRLTMLELAVSVGLPITLHSRA